MGITRQIKCVNCDLGSPSGPYKGAFFKVIAQLHLPAPELACVVLQHVHVAHSIKALSHQHNHRVIGH